ERALLERADPLPGDPQLLPHARSLPLGLTQIELLDDVAVPPPKPKERAAQLPSALYQHHRFLGAGLLRRLIGWPVASLVHLVQLDVSTGDPGEQRLHRFEVKAEVRGDRRRAVSHLTTSLGQ